MPEPFTQPAEEIVHRNPPSKILCLLYVGRLIFASGQKQNLRNLHFLHPLWKTFFELFYLSIWNKNGKTQKIRILLLEIKNLRLGKCWEDFWKKPCYNDTDRKREPRERKRFLYKHRKKKVNNKCNIQNGELRIRLYPSTTRHLERRA